MTAINILVLADCDSIITNSKAVASTSHSFNVAKARAIPHLRLALLSATQSRLGEGRTRTLNEMSRLR